MKPIKLDVKTKLEKYPIIIGSNIVKNLYFYLKKNSIKFEKCLLVIDNKVPNIMISKILKSLKKKEIYRLYHSYWRWYNRRCCWIYSKLI